MWYLRLLWYWGTHQNSVCTPCVAFFAFIWKLEHLNDFLWNTVVSVVSNVLYLSVRILVHNSCSSSKMNMQFCSKAAGLFCIWALQVINPASLCCKSRRLAWFWFRLQFFEFSKVSSLFWEKLCWLSGSLCTADICLLRVSIRIVKQAKDCIRKLIWLWILKFCSWFTMNSGKVSMERKLWSILCPKSNCCFTSLSSFSNISSFSDFMFLTWSWLISLPFSAWLSLESTRYGQCFFACPFSSHSAHTNFGQLAVLWSPWLWHKWHTFWLISSFMLILL